MAHDTKSQENHGVSDRRQPANAETRRVLGSSDEDLKAAIVTALQRSITNALETLEGMWHLHNETGARTKDRGENPGANAGTGGRARWPGRENESRVSELGADNRIHTIAAQERNRRKPETNRAPGTCGEITKEPTFLPS